MNELADVYIRADLVVRIQACDVRIDELRMPFERQGDTMVAILDEVSSTDLEDVDRRRVPIGEGCPQVLQSAA